MDLYDPSLDYQERVWSATGLTPGPHSVRIEWTGTKNASSTNTYVGIDAADVVGTLTQAHYEQNSPKLLYEGTWSSAAGIDHSAGRYAYSTSADAAVNIAFSGTGFTWLTAKGPFFGKATVVLDNGTPVEIDLYNPSTAYQQNVWSVSGLANGPHTIRIQPTGTKNPASTNYYVGLDAMDVAAGTITPAHFERWLTLFHETLELGWTGPNTRRALDLADNVASVHSHQLLGHAVSIEPSVST